MSEHKRRVSQFFPIRLIDGKLQIYLQKRTPEMVNPNNFGPFGGHAEGDEDSEQALVREVKEELDMELDLDEVEFFEHYEFMGSVKDVFIFHAPEKWEQSITVKEGEYGEWFWSGDALDRSDIIFSDKIIINDLERKLINGKLR